MHNNKIIGYKQKNMPFHVQKRRAMSVFHRLTGKFGKELFEVKPEKTFVSFLNLYLFE